MWPWGFFDVDVIILNFVHAKSLAQVSCLLFLVVGIYKWSEYNGSCASFVS